MIIVSVHVHFFSLSVSSVYVSQVTSGYIRSCQVSSGYVYVGGTGRGARQLSKLGYLMVPDSLGWVPGLSRGCVDHTSVHV